MKADKLVSKFSEHDFNIIKGSDLKPIETISTGIPELDEIAGFPRKRITEIYGLPAVGKTSLLMRCIAGLTKENKVLFIDVENTFNSVRAETMGVEIKNLTIANPTLVEDVVELTMSAVRDYDLIMIDSVAAMIPRAEADGDAGDAVMGLKARLMGQFMRKITSPLGRSNCAIVFINQLRENINPYGAPYSTPGGKALEYAASLRVELKSNAKDKIVKAGITTGHWIEAKTTKSKISAPYQVARFKLEY